ncbi:hypothetical protein MNB_ARC-1_299 [hydrothermal vent metagenome]|uniref:Uncharacterized protein n=1 Tax=hydrothermal vent metagenome TaxID=652676 RepID=A0A3B1E8Z5_9ZZZZ
MKKILFLTTLASIYLNALSIEPETQIMSNYVFRGQSQTMNTPSISTKVILKHNGFYIGAWASRVNFDKNNTKHTNSIILDSDAQVDFFTGYELQIGRGRVGAGYIDRRYVIDSNLESNISSEYYVFLNLNIGVDATIKGSYDIRNIIDPILTEVIFKDIRGSTKSYATYGMFLNSSNAYWKLQVDSPLKYLGLKGYISFSMSRYIPKVKTKTQDSIFTISYKF